MQKEALLCFYSGTGNSYRCSVWAAAFLQQQGIRPHLISMHKGKVMPVGSYELLGVFFPTHAFTAPWSVLSFLVRLPRVSKTRAFVLVTRGGLKVGPLALPGLEGSASYLAALLLEMKGYQVQGIQAVDLPSNWTTIHPALPEEVVAGMLCRAQERVEAFIKGQGSGERVWGGLFPLIVGLFLLPISLSFLLYGRFILARLFFASTRCQGCATCLQFCPEGAIGMVRERPFWSYSCKSCMRCMAYCPHQAVEAVSFWYLVIFMLLIIPFGVLVVRFYPLLSQGLLFWRVLLVYGMSLLLAAGAYRLFHYFLGFPALNDFVTRTTWTRHFRRYHEPQTKGEDLL